LSFEPELSQEIEMQRRSLVAAFLALLMLPAAAFGAEFRVLSSWDQSYPVRPKMLEVYLKNVETASNGDMKFIISGPETVPPFEQLQPVGSGVFQILFTHGAYHIGQTPYLLAVEALGGDLKKWRDAGVRELIDKHYQKFGLKLVALGQTPEQSALQIILRQPVGPSGDLKGRKLRGTQTFAGVFAALGASPVVLPASEIYSSLEKGVVDGAGWPVLGVLDYRWYEVAKYIARPTFGMLTYPIFFNLNAWNKLTDPQRKILLDEGRKIEDLFYVEWTKLADEEAAKLMQNGAQITNIGGDRKDQLNKALVDTLFQLGMQYNPKDIGELREFAKTKGLYN
jgi:TRAP-type C4-dicarboxylate transport system substrate-binding protein